MYSNSQIITLILSEIFGRFRTKIKNYFRLTTTNATFATALVFLGDEYRIQFRTFVAFHSELWLSFTTNFGGVLLQTLAKIAH